MIEYEYKVVETDLDPKSGGFIKLLNALGRNKWELVTMERFLRGPESDEPTADIKLFPARLWLLFLIRRKNV